MSTTINFQLVGLKPPHDGKPLALAPGEVIVGRAGGASIRLEEAGVSTRHARLVVSAEQVIVHDTSRNGTYVDGAKISEPTTLRGGERLKFGQTPFRLERLGAPAAEPVFQLIGHSAPHTDRVVALRAGQLTIGRSPQSNLLLADHMISSNHARIVVEPELVTLHDCSSNGTFVNEQRISQPRPLRGGETLRFGPFSFTLERLGGSRPATARVPRSSRIRERPEVPQPERRVVGWGVRLGVLVVMLGGLVVVGYRLFEMRRERVQSGSVSRAPEDAGQKERQADPGRSVELGALEQASVEAWRAANSCLARQDVLGARELLLGFRRQIGDVGGRLKLDANALEKHIEDWIDTHFGTTQKALHQALRAGRLESAVNLLASVKRPGMEKLGERVTDLDRQLAVYYPSLSQMGIKERNQPLVAPEERYKISTHKVWGGTIKKGGSEKRPTSIWSIGVDRAAHLVFLSVPRNIARYKTLRFRIKGTLPLNSFLCVQLSNPDVRQRMRKRIEPPGKLEQIQIPLSAMKKTSQFNPARVLLLSFLAIGCRGQQVELAEIELDVLPPGKR